MYGDVDGVVNVVLLGVHERQLEDRTKRNDSGDSHNSDTIKRFND
jgi:hypothetical protein